MTDEDEQYAQLAASADAEDEAYAAAQRRRRNAGADCLTDMKANGETPPELSTP